MSVHNLTRRRALSAAAAVLVGSKVAPGSTAGVQPGAERAGVAPRAELVNTLEQAKLKLAPAVFSLTAVLLAKQRDAEIQPACIDQPPPWNLRALESAASAVAREDGLLRDG